MRHLLTGVVDIKPSNVDVQLADFGSSVHMDSLHAQHGDPSGTPSNAMGPATDIWSFGAMLISLSMGDGFYIFKPDVPADHDEDDLRILMKSHRCFGPFSESYEEFADQQRLAVLVWVMQNSPPETLRPFHLTTSQEIYQEDKVLRAMKLDPRDRPSARQLLEDGWLHQF
ncbi:putative serine/threonine protein kinase [Aspergillus novofumigatus IBT 16806]|uniref:Protein kinase domain-containing protein n=1 Tax=Aspergillus novofumigatus (strain IBT 16806) TaxID=1392255 RepID=A0A2I1C2S7_ASPN1|nr:uncharacterized protein P174DRAFT_462451 [Aspergillus novofumigatus IBT 16806]PKX91950.1 hypothetical protein P174DRAFT_462451 [Aspergillus novofumigatus IBT 16806]